MLSMCASVLCVRSTTITFVFLIIFKTTSPLQNFNTTVSGSVTVTRVPVIVGHEVNLPCDTEPSRRNDSLLLIVWYRDGNPVYSYDTRESGSPHWADEPYSGRTLWLAPTSELKIRDVQATDRAVYTCRVDFHVSPTRNYRVALDVVEPPEKPVIIDQFGNQVLDIAGPYSEGQDFKLTCTVKGGVPKPRIQWLQNGTVLKSLRSEDLPAAPSRSLVLEVRNASRDLLGTEYSCTAENTLLVESQKTTIHVDLYMKPLSAEIIPRDLPLSAGRKVEMLCKAKGSKPPAVITWFLGDKEQNATTRQSDSDETDSILDWTPSKEHAGQLLICRVKHPKSDFPVLERKLHLNVQYAPEPSIHFDVEDPNDIEEGGDVNFSCVVDASPPAYKIVWQHNGALLQNNPENGVEVQNTRLVLRKVSRQQAGMYSCIASNVEGDGQSADLHMRVVYTPLCQRDGAKVLGAALQEPLTVACEVDAYPPPSSFQWHLNTSTDSIEVDPQRYTIESNKTKSVLTFIPVSDIDYGTLSCRATNSAGQQELPCLYTVLPAMKPDPPANCTVYNLTHDSLDLLCSPGFDGGLQCIYVAEVWATEGLVVNASNDMALWNLRRLGANRPLRLVVYAANARGRSEHVTFAVTTAVRRLPQIESLDTFDWTLNWSVGLFFAVVFTIAIILCLALIATRIRHRSRDYEVNIQTLKNENRIVQKLTSQNFEEKNPDLIPLNKDTTPAPPLYSAVTSSHKNSSAHSLHQPANTPPSKYYTHYDSQNDQAWNNMLNGPPKTPREVFTTKIPLLGPHQESCV